MLYDSELARRANGGIEIRPAGLRVRWELTDLLAADGHTIQAIFACTVRALPDPTEQKMLEESLLGARPVATTSDVAAHFASALLTAARRYASTCQAETLLADTGRQGLLAALLDAGKAVAFGCGIELLPPTEIDLHSPTLQRAQMETNQRQAAQRRAADEVDHLRRSTELFNQFQALRASAPELSPGQALQRVGLADQPDALRSLLLASAAQAPPAILWAVAGPNLIHIAGDESPSPQLIAVPPALGPIRSVRSDGADGLLLGCQTGVMRIHPHSPQTATLYRDPQVTSQLGFNAAVVTEDRLYASHGEAGLVCWKLSNPDHPETAIRPASVSIAGFSPRNLLRLGSNRLLLTTGPQLLALADTGSLTPINSPADSDIVALLPHPHGLLAPHQDGSLTLRAPDDLHLISQQRRTGRILAAAPLPWLGDTRLLLAAEDGPLLCIGVDDELITQYASPHRAPRIVAASPRAVAAVTSDRQRLLLWHTWDGRKPHADLHLYALAKHRIADIAFI